jgi:hypothetical protein
MDSVSFTTLLEEKARWRLQEREDRKYAANRAFLHPRECGNEEAINWFVLRSHADRQRIECPMNQTAGHNVHWISFYLLPLRLRHNDLAVRTFSGMKEEFNIGHHTERRFQIELFFPLPRSFSTPREVSICLFFTSFPILYRSEEERWNFP